MNRDETHTWAQTPIDTGISRESLLTIGEIPGHAGLSSTRIYARLSLDAVSEAVDKTVTAMLAAGKGEDDGE